jgi:hypothetical protein
MYDSTNYDTASVELDFGLKTQPILSVGGIGGRASWDNIAWEPTIKITPVRSEAVSLLSRTLDSGPMLIQFGRGSHSGTDPAGLLNTCCAYINQATLVGAEDSDNNGRLMNALSFRATDAGYYTPTTATAQAAWADFFLFARA